MFFMPVWHCGTPYSNSFIPCRPLCLTFGRLGRVCTPTELTLRLLGLWSSALDMSPAWSFSTIPSDGRHKFDAWSPADTFEQGQVLLSFVFFHKYSWHAPVKQIICLSRIWFYVKAALIAKHTELEQHQAWSQVHLWKWSGAGRRVIFFRCN